MANNGRIEIRHNFTGETGYVILTWQKTSAPLTEVGREVYPAPHTQDTLLVTELAPVMFLVRAWRSSDGVSLDEQINELACDAKSGALFPITRIEYNVNGPGTYDPISDTNYLRDPRLLDMNYWVEERGTGSLFTDEITDRSDAGGGFDFTEVGKVFNDQARYVVYIIERVDAGSGVSGSGGGATGVILLEGSVLDADDFDANTMDGKLLVTDYSALVGTLNFPALSTIPDCSFRYSAHGGMQNYGVWQLNPGDTVQFKNQALNALYFEKGSSVTCDIIDNVMYLSNYSGNYERRGTVVGDSNSTRAATLGNLLLADESTGELEGTDYPGLLEYVQSLPVGAYVPLGTGSGQWGESQVIRSGQIDQATTYPNKSKWGITGDKIRVPHLAGRTRKFVNTGENAGRYEHDQVGSHEGTLSVEHGYTFTGPPNSTRFGNGANSPTYEDHAFVSDTGNTETKVINFGEIPFIVL